MSVSFYLPDPLEDVGGEGRHPWRSARELHQHRQQLEERIGCLMEGESNQTYQHGPMPPSVLSNRFTLSVNEADVTSYLRSQLGDGGEEHRHDLSGGESEQ